MLLDCRGFSDQDPRVHKISAGRAFAVAVSKHDTPHKKNSKNTRTLYSAKQWDDALHLSIAPFSRRGQQLPLLTILEPGHLAIHSLSFWKENLFFCGQKMIPGVNAFFLHFIICIVTARNAEWYFHSKNNAEESCLHGATLTNRTTWTSPTFSTVLYYT